jgi:AraC-like DNA-binding protein
MPLEDKMGLTGQNSKLGRVMFIELSIEKPTDERRAEQTELIPTSVIKRVEDYCRKNYARPIGVADMAKVAKLSRFYFSRLFLKTIGISPGQYLRGLRLVMAMRLVQAGEHAIKDIAKQCGFTSTSYLCRVFRETFGATPGGVATFQSFRVEQSTSRTPSLRTRARRAAGQRSHPN